MSAPRLGARGRQLELGCDVIVRLDHGCRAMPGVPISLVRRATGVRESRVGSKPPNEG
jgi:hypothetical protein